MQAAAAGVPKWTFRDSGVSGDLSSAPCALLFTGLHSYLILPPDAHYASLQHLLLGQLLKS